MCGFTIDEERGDARTDRGQLPSGGAEASEQGDEDGRKRHRGDGGPDSRHGPEDEPAEGVLIAWGITLEGRKVLLGLQLASRES